MKLTEILFIIIIIVLMVSNIFCLYLEIKEIDKFEKLSKRKTLKLGGFERMIIKYFYVTDSYIDTQNKERKVISTENKLRVSIFALILNIFSYALILTEIIFTVIMLIIFQNCFVWIISVLAFCLGNIMLVLVPGCIRCGFNKKKIKRDQFLTYKKSNDDPKDNLTDNPNEK